MKGIEERDQIFSKRSEDIQTRLKKNEKKSNLISNIRFVLFILVVASLAATITFKLAALAYLVPSVLFLLFLFLVFYHAQIKRDTTLLQTLDTIHKEYLARIVHDFSPLSDTGEDFLDTNHDFSSDLDLFGSQSLYHLLSTARTWYGRTTFADYLLTAGRADKTREEIAARQAAVSELKDNLQMVQEFEAAGRLSVRSAEDPRRLLAYAEETDGDKPPVTTICLVISAINSLLFILFGLLAWGFVLIPVFVPLIFLCVQIVLVALKYQRFKPVFASVEDFHEQLLSYIGLFQKIEQSKVSADLLVNLQRDLYDEETRKSPAASLSVKRLHAICLLIQARSQPLLFFILNVLFQYDVFCIFALEKWRKSNGSRLLKYVRALGEWEALMSLTTITYIYPEFSFPVFRGSTEDPEQQAYFSAVSMGHPLIPVKKQVRNDFSLPSGISLITGSNMSGKTTLLRTVGINAVLAYAGTYCCAEKIEMGFMQIGSSMRIADDLSEGVSTFYAELIRIEKIIRKSREGKPLLFLIDEIFRGTNSRDRTDGAKIVLKNLSEPWIIGLMSTHDYELCSEENQKDFPILNYHFSEHYDEEGIHFDYVLSEGISTSTNARFLMKLIGIE
jgi:Flp pilus assembly protein TadB